MRRIHVLMMAGLFCATGACDKDKASTETKPEPAASPAAATETKAPVDPHANPHAGAADPHGAMAHGGGQPAKMERGEPRDITPTGETNAEELADLKVAVPKEWEKGQPTSNMRLAQFKIPGPGGDAELVVFRFPGGAGGVEANLDRWKKQFTPPEGKTLDDISKVEKFKAGDLQVTLLDVQGRFVAAVMPGAAAQYDEPDARMLAAIVEGVGDPFFLKAVGPQKTLEVWAAPFRKMLESAAKK